MEEVMGEVAPIDARAVMQDDFIDLDRAIDEAGEKPLRVKVKGSFIDFPAAVPALLVYKLLRMMGTKGEVDPSQVPDFWDILIGEEKLQQMFDLGMTYPQLTQLQDELLKRYNIAGDEGEAGNPQ